MNRRRWAYYWKHGMFRFFRVRLIDWTDLWSWKPSTWIPGHGRSFSWLGVTIWMGVEEPYE